MIAAAAPHLRLARFATEIESAVAGVLSASRLILGEQVEAFEARFAAYTGVAHCAGVNSGTDAIELALRAAGVGHGDEVIVPAMTAPATAMAVLRAGARPRIVDVDPATRCIDPAAIEAAITPRTAAIVPVHLHGHVADMPRVMAAARRHALVVVEDCAQAHGATEATTGRRAGSFGTAAAFSFYPTKNLGAAGDGGAVVTDDAALAGRVRALRSYGWDADRRSATAGFNSRLDELQAAVLGVLLGHLDASNGERAAIAGTYRVALADGARAGAVVLPPDRPGAVHHQFAIESDDRDRLREWLHAHGVGTAVHYAAALHQHPALAEHAAGAELPVAEALAARFVSLPIQPEAVGEHAAFVAEAVAEGIAVCAGS